MKRAIKVTFDHYPNDVTMFTLVSSNPITLKAMNGKKLCTLINTGNYYIVRTPSRSYKLDYCEAQELYLTLRESFRSRGMRVKRP